MDKRVEVLDITLTNGLFVMLDNVTAGEQMFNPQTAKRLGELRKGTLELLRNLRLDLDADWDVEMAEEVEASQEKLEELIDQTREYFLSALTYGTFEAL